MMLKNISQEVKDDMMNCNHKHIFHQNVENYFPADYENQTADDKNNFIKLFPDTVKYDIINVNM